MLKKWNEDKWKSYYINLNGSHSKQTWIQALYHLEKINKDINIETLADIACGENPLEFEKIPEFKHIKKIYRIDGVEDYKEKHSNIILCDLNKEKIPLKDNEVDFSIAIEIIEHLYDTHNFIVELARISKKGFLISKPNTDINGINSKWYGMRNFYVSKNKTLINNGLRHEHINFIPNYELIGFGWLLGYDVKLLDDINEEIQFFLFTEGKNNEQYVKR